jgi:hypothetical protein
MRIERIWAMPNSKTFQIQPIANLLTKEIAPGYWLDPFSGGSRIVADGVSTITNDLRGGYEIRLRHDTYLAGTTRR